MADKKISELPAASALDTDDLLAVVEDGTTKKATIQNLLDLAPSGNGIPTVINAVTDYGAVGDGVTNDATAINNALSAASAAGGGVVYLPESTYLVGTAGSSSIILSVPSEVTLRGEGAKATIIKSASTTAGHTPIGFATSATHARVESLGVTNATSTTSSHGVMATTNTDCVVSDCWIDSVFGWGVFIQINSQHVSVIRTVIDGTTQSHGVEINGSSYCSVDSCHITNGGPSDDGNNIELYDSSAYRVVGTRITNNHFHGSAGGAGSSSGIIAAGDIGTVIADNHFTDCDLFGISLVVSAFDAARYSRAGTITGNVIRGCNRASGANGIDITTGGRFNTVTGNTVETTALAGTGINVDGINNTVTGNVCNLNGGNGILVNTNAHRTTLIGNHAIDNSGVGVGSRSGIDVQANYCKVVGNVGSDTRGGSNRQYHGVTVTGTDHIVIGNGGTGNQNVAVNDSGTNSTMVGNEKHTGVVNRIPGLIIGTDVQAWDTDLDAVALNGRVQAPMISGLFYPAPQGGTTSTLAPTLNTVYYCRLIRPGGRLIDQVGCEVVVASTGSGVLRFGVYTDVAGVPTTLVADLGTANSDTPTSFANMAANVAAASSTLWLAVCPQTSVASLTLRSVTGFGGWGTTAGLSAARLEGGYTQASVSGALPGTATVGSKVVANMPVIVARSA